MSRRNQLLLFFVLAYAFSWIVEIPLALSATGRANIALPFALHYLAGYGPMLAAIVVAGLAQGAGGVKELATRIVKWRIGWIWWAAALSPLLLYAGVALFLWLRQGSWPDFALLGEVNFLPPLGFWALPLWLFTFAIGEETGWRGFALPRLQATHSALTATVILWALWALWHLPLFFYSYEPSVIPGMLAGLFAGAIVLTWLYNSTRGSLLMVILWHGGFNFITASAAGAGMAAAVESVFVIVLAVVIVALCRPANLSFSGKQMV